MADILRLVLAIYTFQGQATDIAIHAKRIIAIKDKMNEILSQRTGQPKAIFLPLAQVRRRIQHTKHIAQPRVAQQ